MRVPFSFQVLFVVLCWIVVQSNSICAQDPSALGPLEPSDTSSPAATLNSLIDSCNQLSKQIKSGAAAKEREDEILPTIDRILDCLDLSELPKELQTTAGLESALFLKEVLDRIELPSVADIPAPTDQETQEVGQLPLSWQIPRTRITIAESRTHKNEYVFTPEAVRRAAQFYRIVKEYPYRTDGPETSPGLHDEYVAITRKKPTLTADTSSPRGTLTMFLDNCNELHELVEQNHYLDRSKPEFHELGNRILSCLDSSQLPEFSREFFDGEAAVCLKEMLDRVALPPAEAIPGIESVDSADGSEALIRWQVPGTQIVIGKMVDGPRRGEFLFTSETVSRAPQLYSKAKSRPYRTDGRPISDGLYEWWLSRPANPTVASWVDSLPNSFQKRIWGMAIWQWIGVLILTPICLAFIFVTFRVGQTRGEQARGRNLFWYWFGLVLPVMGILIPIGFKHVIWEYLSIRANALYVLSFCADIVFLLGVMVLIVRTSSRVAESFVALPGVAPRGLDASLIRILCRVLGIVAAAIVFLEGGRYLGFPLTTLIASAGIGGLAIALSAQGLIKSLFGTVTVLLDKPYRVGERIVVKEHDGFVEDIGLRSTKIRTLDNRMISIPNDMMAEAEIQNIGNHKFIRRISDLRIPLDTPRQHVEQAVMCIRQVLENQDSLSPEIPPRVHFTEFNPDSFNIRVTYWFGPPNLPAFQNFSEKINLEIMRAFEKNGIQFSLPFRHTYWKQDDQQGPLEVVLKNAD